MIVHPDKSQVLPLFPEPITRQDGASKNDGESNASKRLLASYNEDTRTTARKATGSFYYSNDKTSIFIPPSMPFALAIVNSSVSWWFTQQTFASKQGGFFEFKPMYFSQLPIPKTTVSQQKTVEILAQYLLWLNQIKIDVIPRIINYFEHLLNGLVYELFFPDELQAQKLTLFKHVEEASLPAIDSVLENQRLAVVQESFERLNEPNHLVQDCLYSLGSLESVRIIEGEAGTGPNDLATGDEVTE